MNQDTAPASASEVDTSDDDAVIAYVQKTRLRVASTFLGENLSSDPRERELAVGVLRDMTATAMAKKKLGAAERQGDRDREAQLLIAALHNQSGGKSPFEVIPVPNGPVVEREIPRVRFNQGGEPAFADSFKERGISFERYDDFQARMEPVIAERLRNDEAEVMQELAQEQV